MASVLELTMRGRSAVSQIDRATRRQLQDAYDTALSFVEREIARGEMWIQAAIDAGEPVSHQWLQRQQWYRQLEADIERQMTTFTTDASRILANGQTASLIAANGTAASIAGLFQGRVNAPAFERWVSAMQPGTPIRNVIDGYGERVSDAVLRHMTEGMGAGQGSATITRRIMDDVGDRATRSRMETTVRTETHRAYRGGFADSMEPMERDGIVTGYRWLSARDSRTCLACLVMDGQEFDKYPELFHVSCRCVCQPIVRAGLVPGGRDRETGRDWLARQDEDTQRRIMGPTRYGMWREGTNLDDMLGIEPNRIWGDAITLRPIRDLRGAA
jgi:hypothetical protein